MVKLNKQNREQYINLVLDALHKEDKEEFRKTLLAMHPSDQLDIFITLDETARKRSYKYLAPNEFADIFGGMKTEDQKNFFKELDQSYSSLMFNNMFTDDVVNFLIEIDDKETDDILLKMDAVKAKKIRDLLAYTEETAGAIMTKEFISIASTDTAANVIDHLRREASNAEIIYYNYVVDHVGTLVGVVSLRDLIMAAPDEVIQNIMSTRAVSVLEDLDQEEVANIIQKYDFLAVPVVTKEDRLLGIVTVDDVMDILEDETTEDFGDISAAKDTTDTNLSAFTAAKKRSPWIIALMFFGLITAGIIGSFEETLESVVLLAVFIPLIMDSAGNTGTQSLAVAVRGLALGTINKDDIGKMIRREFGIGIMLGLICMILLTGMISLIYGNWLLALIVGFSIFCTLSISTVVGAIVPMLTTKLKLDPAIASGPFITTVNDILGLLIYFSIATTLMDFL